MFSKVKAAMAACVLSTIAAAPASAGVIFFDGFESPDEDNWGVYQVVGDNGDWVAVEGAGIEIQDESIGITSAFEGEQYVELDSDNARGGLPGDTNSAMATFIDFVVGQTYEISFAYKPRTNTANDNIIELFAVNFDGSNIVSQLLLATANETTSSLGDWTVISVLFTVQQGFNGIALAAGGLDNSLGGFIDAVSVSEVPIPAALPLFVFGMAGVGAMMRRKRKIA
ncbi:MAG: VPLPA-CTERM sorting domain-containing protein [Pseudomonadota bacterium]